MRYHLFLIVILLTTLNTSLTYERPDPLKPIRIDTVYDSSTDTNIEYSVDDTSATFSITIPETLTKDIEGERYEKIIEETPLYPSYLKAAEDSEYPVLPSIEFCSQKGKFFDDGVYSAIEVALEIGISQINEGRQAILKDMITALKPLSKQGSGRVRKAYSDALAFTSTAFLLGGGTIEELGLPDEIAKEAKTLALCSAIDKNDTIETRIRFLNDLFSGLTNPSRYYNPEHYKETFGDCGETLEDDALFNSAHKKAKEDRMMFALIPPSMSKEVDLMYQLPVTGDIENLMPELIKAIRDGRLSLEPDEESGWYQYQQYALECLLKFNETRESSKLSVDDNYIRRLETAFASVITQARETHIKSLEKYITEAKPPPERIIEVTIYPEFTLEPMATYYLRVARGYGFLEKILSNYLDEEWYELKPLHNGKASEENLKKYLDYIKDLFYGFYIESCVNIGIEPELEEGELEDEAGGVVNQARRYLQFWQDALSGDPLMGEDIRVIVPVGMVERGMLCWAVLGVKPVVINVAYDRYPVVKSEVPGVKLDVNYKTRKYTILVPEFAEVIIPTSEPLNRDEFRNLCDKYKTREMIIEALESYKGKLEEKKFLGLEGSGLTLLAKLSILLVIIAVAVIAMILIFRYIRKKRE
ncbi:MAG: hypothetical protein B6D57_03825 [Candidatus Coatesbacteria bacterium 4484_99]|uniref:Uncharacterized protein n=1 Tax=Candidatus Coatesbacteria bacterium 4484_99 TaxID=1970774 RepID=A0A1W9S1Y9_9BACT|nr:MAG: hypothetical protein B6D57_03825 [Candidatus Coatesbacteria bacterium 4484_99]